MDGDLSRPGSFRIDMHIHAHAHAHAHADGRIYGFRLSAGLACCRE
jgi:hypothetical protein